MKNLWLVVAFVTIVSCTPKKKADYAIITGKIENATSNKVTIYSAFDRDSKIEITLKEDGTFKDTLRLSTDFYLLRQDRSITDFFAPKGSEMKVTYDAKKKDSTLQFTGSESAVNKYLLDKEKVTKDTRGNAKKMFLKDETDFKEHLLKIKTAQENLFSSVKGVSENYKSSELKSINYEYLAALSNYQSYHGYYIKDRSYKVSDTFLDELKNLDIENENDFLFSKNYRDVVQSLLSSDAKMLVEKDSIADDIAYLKTVADIKNDKIKNKLLFDSAKYGITYTENLEGFYTLFSKNSTNKENNKKITEAYNKLKALSKGSPSPKFSNYENNDGTTTSLDDLKGKYLYLDIWATWCGPCIAEIPSLKKLEKEFHGKNIEFVSISIDRMKDHEKWKKMIVDKELKGIQLFADSNWESQFIKDYMIKGIPRFILIDPQGNIINANAPRPSDKKLVQTLNSLKL
jgi:thiol-disulfide isomerase/thioredoxin